jgi:hydroxypyruvate reductase
MKKKSQLRADALAIFQAALESVDSARVVNQHLQLEKGSLTVGGKSYILDEFENIYVIGAGKASAAMAQAVENRLSGRITSGLINVKYGHSRPLKTIAVQEAGHPVPDRAGMNGSEQIMRLLEGTSKNDLVIVLISGGGSALLPLPAEGLELEDIQKTTQVLLEVGANIDEINTIRKHISRVKGGWLAKQAYPAAVVSLILSDVIGDHLESIASGPTAPDSSTFSDCLAVVEKFGIQRRIPRRVFDFIALGLKGKKEETVKPEDPVFQRVQNVIVGSNIQAVRAARKKALNLGYNSLILSSAIEGETREVAKVFAAVAKEIISSANPLSSPACLISGGETTVTIRGRGLGGRNQEFVLASAIAIDGLDNIVILSCGTDGTDGPTDAAGAIADGRTLERARNRGLKADEFLSDNDSYHFFQALDDLILTGPTFTNVMDIRLILVK